MNTEQELIKRAEALEAEAKKLREDVEQLKAPSQESPFWEPKPGDVICYFDRISERIEICETEESEAE